ncbi:muellerian-inhibiting factor isoform X1 [Sander lucioperca]|uniref:Anti-Mullerian hormone n=1 Tax=Sander lucioperca TaxID=283035 RepID=A0A8C9YML4_SANLU|nr:muellerian-inhibiting factor isoform X1 [Sander lucioperca]XP_031174307.1 muellerian-inhibiting factor isoform X1 [Sander lucioperca]XP_035863405.1 muellerian-inhibiting factor isoform X1 [Sander lucioperca]
MLFLNVFYCGALMLCCTRLCVALHVSHGQQLIPDHHPPLTEHTFPPTETSSASTVFHHVFHNAPCFVDDIFAVLCEGVGSDGELTNRTLTQFGICTGSDSLSDSVLLQLAKETSRNQINRLEVLHPTGVLLAEEDKRGMLTLTFDLPQSPLIKLNPVLLLAYESPLTVTGGNLDVTFNSQWLHPNTQSVCISGETQYIMLTGKASEANIHQNWRISVETKNPDMNQSLKDILIGGKSGSNISMTPLLLFSGERGTDTSYTHTSGSSPASSQTSFLCELKRFLGDVLPQELPESPPLQLNSLQSLPPLTLGLSSSDTLLAGLINSSSQTIFSFNSWGSMFQVHRGELALSPALLEELRQRLEQSVIKMMELIREEEVGHRAMARLGRLKELSAFPKEEPAAGESQYRAFLLLKALQTVARAYELQRGLRATRAGSNNPEGGNICGLRSLTVSLIKILTGPNTANINNCHGFCAFPLSNPNNHAILLNSHIGSGNVDERAPCCVPVAYEDLEVVNFDNHGTSITIQPNMVAKECGCR